MESVIFLFSVIGAFVFGILIAIFFAGSDNDGDTANDESYSQGMQVNNDAMQTQENVLGASASSIKAILVGLALTIRNLDGAATKSTDTLSQVRSTVKSISLPDGIEKCQDLIISEVDKVITTNLDLRGELASAQEEMDKQRMEISKLQIASKIDRLTHINNRASFDEYLENVFAHYKQTHEQFSLIILDIDHFKKVNDTFGHVAGDKVLEAVSEKLSGVMRASDFISRYGGEEFAAVLINAKIEDSIRIAESMRKTIASSVFDFDGGKLEITISAGVTEVIPGDTTDTLIKRADAELYKAKESGRNRVCPIS